MGEDATCSFTRLEGGIENGLIELKTGPPLLVMKEQDADPSRVNGYSIGITPQS